jgi:8-oxo-dGTP pyrophosphatase MutT (NUDIX family)
MQYIAINNIVEMEVKIYFNNKCLLLTDTITTDIEEYLHQNDTIFIDELDDHAVRTMIFEMNQPEIYRGVYYFNDVPLLLSNFKRQLTLITAAGGFVYDDGYVLLIFRRGKWDLPKGKLDDGENLEECAMREINEETGLKKLCMESPLIVTYHTYQEKGRQILKESNWFRIRGSRKDTISPQYDEDIEQCKWVPFNELSDYFDHAHAAIVDVIKEGLKTLKEPKLGQ